MPAVLATRASDHSLNCARSAAKTPMNSAIIILGTVPAITSWKSRALGRHVVHERVDEVTDPRLEGVDQPRGPRLLEEPPLPRVNGWDGIEQHRSRGGSVELQPVAVPAGPDAGRVEDGGDRGRVRRGEEVSPGVMTNRTRGPQFGECRVRIRVDRWIERVVRSQ